MAVAFLTVIIAAASANGTINSNATSTTTSSTTTTTTITTAGAVQDTTTSSNGQTSTTTTTTTVTTTSTTTTTTTTAATTTTTATNSKPAAGFSYKETVSQMACKGHEGQKAKTILELFKCFKLESEEGIDGLSRSQDEEQSVNNRYHDILNGLKLVDQVRTLLPFSPLLLIN